MNIRKNIDYTELYEALDGLMTRQLPQMELYCGIGKAVCRRTEKGAAVMASEYLNKKYPDVKGFSPRSLRRMWDFYRTYEGHPSLLSRAMNLGWTLNVVIMEADLTMELREWYMKTTEQFSWSKSELIAAIDDGVHESKILNSDTDFYPSLENEYVAATNMVKAFFYMNCLCRLRVFISGINACIDKFRSEVYCFWTLSYTVVMRC